MCKVPNRVERLASEVPSMKRNKILPVLVVLFAFGMIVGSSNFQWQIDLVEAGDWIDIPVEFEQESLLPDVGFSLAGASMGHFEILLLGTFTAGFYPILNPLFVLILDTADIIVRGSWDE
jgi:hypothetical protein